MDEDKLLALEFTKAFIQNNNVKPVFQVTSYDPSDEISYLVGDARYTFTNLVSHFLENIQRIEKW